MSATKYIWNKKNWNRGTIQVHVDPPLIPLIKSKNYEKPDKARVKIKLLRDPTSQKSDPHELKMALFDNGEPEEFLLLILGFPLPLNNR